MTEDTAASSKLGIPKMKLVVQKDHIHGFGRNADWFWWHLRSDLCDFRMKLLSMLELGHMMVIWD
jgi:hypothetical protein